jgi:ADP-ribose pyrophosphatase
MKLTELTSVDFAEITLDSREVYHGRLLHVFEDRVRLPDGHESGREYVRHPGAVIIVPFLDAQTLLLEYQYRYPLRRHFLEFPAGKIEAGDPPLETAQRELLEETGYVAEHWQHLATTHPCIGYSNEVIELFVARGLRFEGHQRDAGELLEVVKARRTDILAAIRAGTITDTKTVFAMLWLEQFAGHLQS